MLNFSKDIPLAGYEQNLLLSLWAYRNPIYTDYPPTLVDPLFVRADTIYGVWQQAVVSLPLFDSGTRYAGQLNSPWNPLWGYVPPPSDLFMWTTIRFRRDPFRSGALDRSVWTAAQVASAKANVAISTLNYTIATVTYGWTSSYPPPPVEGTTFYNIGFSPSKNQTCYAAVTSAVANSGSLGYALAGFYVESGAYTSKPISGVVTANTAAQNTTREQDIIQWVKDYLTRRNDTGIVGFDQLYYPMGANQADDPALPNDSFADRMIKLYKATVEDGRTWPDTDGAGVDKIYWPSGVLKTHLLEYAAPGFGSGFVGWDLSAWSLSAASRVVSGNPPRMD
ncbi:MAG: hypothetical protein AABY46_06630 [Nitrospirota bacterium]